MTGPDNQPDESNRRLLVDFAAWLGSPETAPIALTEADLIILDANVLLDLYEIGSAAREEVLNALEGLSNLLWVPNQAALEFSRNRTRVVLDRTSSFKQASDSIRRAREAAVNELHRPVLRLMKLRQKTHTSRVWDPEEAGLTKDKLAASLAQILDEASAELNRLTEEQDLQPAHVQSQDDLLRRIDGLLADRIGPPYRSQVLQRLVNEAVLFRYPNNVPPGGLDESKPTQLGSAGDYILWRQVLDKVGATAAKEPSVILVTSERKGDWWILDKNGEPTGLPRPELVQELHEEAGARLILTSLADFIQQSRGTPVSDTTIEQLREAAAIAKNGEVDPVILRSLSREKLQELCRELLMAMGYSSIYVRHQNGPGRDVYVTPSSSTRRAIVNIKHPSDMVSPVSIRDFGKYSDREGGDLIMITTGKFGLKGRAHASTFQVQLIDGRNLVHLLRQYLGIDVQLNIPDDELE